jgi:nitroreductase
MHKRADTSVPIHEILALRWSGRAFNRKKAVNREQLISLLEATRWAPSCFGDEPWRYLVWDRLRDETGWRKAFDCLSPGNRAWVKNAPLLLLSTADSNFVKNGKPNRWGQHDTGAASENLCLQAAAIGLMAHQMGGFDVAKIREAFTIPEHYSCMAMIAVGHPASPEILEGELRERELAPRVRQSLASRFFEGEWGNPVTGI